MGELLALVVLIAYLRGWRDWVSRVLMQVTRLAC